MGARLSIATAVAFLGSTGAFSPELPVPPRGRARGASSSLYVAPKGCAAKPLEKKKIAVFGAGGYLGATLFGFLQRAASLYGTGISPMSSPRAICATNAGAEGLNKVLGPKFKLAYAGEDLIRLVDASDVNHIKERLKAFDACVLGTTYQLEQRSVTLNTYEQNPNAKTFEMYLDERYGAWTKNVPRNDADVHTSIFRNSVEACREAGLSHLVVVETALTACPMDFIDILEEEGVAYTYIRTVAPLTKDINFTFEKGITNQLRVVRLPAKSRLVSFDAESSEEPVVYREDLAALIAQTLMTLDWGESRILEVSSSPGSKVKSEYGGNMPKGLSFAKEWCPNSELLAEVLTAL